MYSHVSVARYGYVFMAMYGYVCMAMYGYVWLYISDCDCMAMFVCMAVYEVPCMHGCVQYTGLFMAMYAWLCLDSYYAWNSPHSQWRTCVARGSHDQFK